MNPPPKWDDNDAIAQPARCVRVPPVGEGAGGPGGGGSGEPQHPPTPTTRVGPPEGSKPSRSSATLLSVARSPGSAGSVMGTPVAPASARKRAAESGLTPSRSRLGGSADMSEGSA